MKKILLFILVFSFTNCDKKYTNEISLVDLVPRNPILLVKYKSSKNLKIENFNKTLNSIINYKSIDSITNRFLSKPILISYHNVGKKNLQSIIFTNKKNVVPINKINDSTEYSGYVIKKFFKNNGEYFSSIKGNIYIESKSKLLLEDALRNSNHLTTDKTGHLEKLYNISNSNITLFVSEKMSDYLNDSKMNEIFNISNFTDWMQFDVEINNKSLTLNGVGIINDSIFKKINVLKNVESSKSKIIKIIPINFKSFNRTAYNHYEYISNIENQVSIKELKRIINDSILYEIDEIGSIVLENDSIASFSFKNKELINEKINNNLISTYKYRGKEIFEFSGKILKTKNIMLNFFPKNISFGTMIENILLLSNDKISIENIILNYINNSTLEKSINFLNSYYNIPENGNLLKVYNIEKFDSLLFKKNKLVQNDYKFWINHSSIEEKFIYKTHAISELEKENNTIGPKIIFNTKLKNSIYTEPKWFTNYVTKKKELIVQDDKNILYLISEGGEIIWEKKLKSKIIGDITQVDLFKNGRLQYAFNTEMSFLVLDKNGKDIHKIDHKKNEKVLGLSVFDYDKNKNYRFLICYKNQIKMLDSKMKIVKGFNKNNIKYNITYPPKHFRIGSKDYLIINTEKKLYITDRRGNSRINISNNLNISKNEIFLHKNSLTTISNDNTLIKIDFNGEISKTTLPLESKYLIYANNKNLTHFSGNSININNNDIEMTYGNYSKPKIFLNDLIQITNNDENKLYLFDIDGSIKSNFPIFGSGQADITKNKKNEKLIAVKGDEKEILVYSLD